MKAIYSCNLAFVPCSSSKAEDLVAPVPGNEQLKRHPQDSVIRRRWDPVARAANPGPKKKSGLVGQEEALERARNYIISVPTDFWNLESSGHSRQPSGPPTPTDISSQASALSSEAEDTHTQDCQWCFKNAWGCTEPFERDLAPEELPDGWLPLEVRHEIRLEPQQQQKQQQKQQQQPQWCKAARALSKLRRLGIRRVRKWM